MTQPAIRLNDLDRLAGLLPDCTPPRAVAELARAACEIQPEGVTLTLKVGVEIDDSKLAEHLAWLTEQTVLHGMVGEAAVQAAEVTPDRADAEAPAADELAANVAESAIEAEPAPAAPPAPPAVTVAEPSQPRPWSEAEEAQLVAARAKGQTFAHIAEQLGRTAKACEMRYRRFRTSDQAPSATPAPTEAPGRPEPAAPDPAPTAAAAPDARSRVTRLVEAMAVLDDSFEPEDDKLLVDQCYVGVGFPSIAADLGCDEDTAKARWRAILKCGVDNRGGLVTSRGWADLRAAVARRAAEAQG